MTASLEPAADASWMRFGELRRRDRWIVELHEGRRPTVVHGFRSQRRAERYARKRTCEHVTATVKPVTSTCGHRA